MGSQYLILQEPITGSYVHIYEFIFLGAEEPPVLFVRDCHPDQILLQLSNLTDMVFILNNASNVTSTKLVRAVEGSRFIPVADGQTYSGVCLKTIDQLTFVEHKEAINSQRLANALEKAPGSVTEKSNTGKSTEPAEAPERA